MTPTNVLDTVPPDELCPVVLGIAEDDTLMNQLLASEALGFALIEANAAGVRVGGKDVIPLSAGLVEDGERQGLLLSRLYDALLASVTAHRALQHQCGQHLERSVEPTTRVLLALDPTLPFETVRQILYTAGQAQISQFILMVDGPAGSPLSLDEASDTDQQLTVSFGEGQAPVYSRLARPEVPPQHGTHQEAIGALLQGGIPGCGLLRPRSDTRWDTVIKSMDDLSGSGASRFILASGDGGGKPAEAAAPASISSLTLSADTVLPAFLLELPAIDPPSIFSALEPSECSPSLSSLPSTGEEPQGSSTDTLIDALNELEPPAQTPAPPRSMATITIGTPSIDGPLRSDLVTQILRRRKNQLKYCYQRALQKEPSLSGSMTARMVINTQGKVEAVTSESLSIDSVVATCVASRLKRVSFPAPPLSTTIWLPLTFSTE